VKKALVVGSGAGGATVAKELQGKFDVTVLEAGKEFHPFSMDLSIVDAFKKTGLMFDEREIQLLFPAMKIRKTADRMVMVNGIGLGGTTTLATGNGIRCDEELKHCGINLDSEFEELYSEIPISTAHQRRWRPATRRLFEICQDMDLHPLPLPKMGDNSKCIRCGRCVLGCESGAKWDSRNFLHQAQEKGAQVFQGCSVEKVTLKEGKVIGVEVRRGWRKEFLPADLVVLSAGGFGTPMILENSGIECEKRLFVDPVLCVATRWKDAFQNKEISMPFVVQRDGYILSPYFDFLSYFFNRDWRFPARDTVGLMIKIADSNIGTLSQKTIDKTLSVQDRERLTEGIHICRSIFAHLGVQEDQIFLGTVNAGHPGGMVPLGKNDADSLHPHHLPANLYIADATLFPSSLGNPPILTIMALAKRVSKVCSRQYA
jgi:choline dehydrogenase-like flavoprotein